jgi:carbon-monoxide dehydrogenase medium subunit
MTTALADDELLAAARLPLLAADTRAGFCEFSRRAGDYALAMALATFRVEDGIIVAPRLGVGGAEASPRRIPEAEAALAGQPAEAAVLRAAAEAAADAIDPLEDIQADAEYRRDLVRAMTRRALERACA